jgi:hypothetical protein
MEGTRVIVRCYGDEPRICVVYQIKNDRVLVTDRDGLNGIRSGKSGPSPIGFPKCDVFEYSLVADMQIKRRQTDKGKFEWGQLKPFML